MGFILVVHASLQAFDGLNACLIGFRKKTSIKNALKLLLKSLGVFTVSILHKINQEIGLS